MFHSKGDRWIRLSRKSVDVNTITHYGSAISWVEPGSSASVLWAGGNLQNFAVRNEDILLIRATRDLRTIALVTHSKHAGAVYATQLKVG